METARPRETLGFLSWEVSVPFSLRALFPSPLPVPSQLAFVFIQIASPHHLLLPHSSALSPFPFCPSWSIFLLLYVASLHIASLSLLVSP